MTLDFLCEEFELNTNPVRGLVSYNAKGVVGKKPTWVEVEQIMYVTTERVEVED